MQIMLFCLLFSAFYGIFHKNKISSPAPAASWLTLGLLTVGNLVFFLQMFRLEVNIYGGVSDRYIWHKLPLWLVVFCLTAEILIFFICLKSNHALHIPNSAMYFLYGMLSVLIGYTFYTPSIFVRGVSDRMHAHAYFNSIYNVYHGLPFSEHTTSIYGHYAILYKLPMKLLGGDFIDFILLNSILGALCFLPVFLALHFTVRNSLLRLLGTIAMTFPILAMRGGFYWQLWPHRILFYEPDALLGRFLCPLSKTEYCHLYSWLSSVHAGHFMEYGKRYVLYRCMDCFLDHPPAMQHKMEFLKILKTCIVHAASAILCFFGAYGMVNAYNLLCGGSVNSIQEFLFPLLTTSYMDGFLRVDLPDYPSAYVPVLILLFLAVAWGLSYMSCFGRKILSGKTEILMPCFSFFTGVLALGQMSYFMNRAAYHNLDICHLPAVLLMCILAERGMDFVRQFRFKKHREYTSSQLFQGTFTAVTLGILLTLNTGTLIEYGYNTDLKTAFHNKQEIHDFAAHIASNIPENTYAFGIGVTEIYSMLRWDTQCYTLDFSDAGIRPQVADYVIEDIRRKDIPAYLVGEDTYKN